PLIAVLCGPEASCRPKMKSNTTTEAQRALKIQNNRIFKAVSPLCICGEFSVWVAAEGCAVRTGTPWLCLGNGPEEPAKE
ncbi:hypothetical protein ACFL2Q_18465, partial [Thermodesulfobacteriota bacterium]